MKIIDIMLCPVLILVFLPVMLIVGFLIYIGDRRSPLYISRRVGKDGKSFILFKFRSMVIDQASSVDSTSITDPRITKIGRWIRHYKVDELPQLFNVMLGSMSIVGPRPNVEREVSLYTQAEKRLLQVKPGMTDFSSIIFSDLGMILKEHDNPDLAYNQLVRPWKGRYGLFYIEKQSIFMDLTILVLTAAVLASRSTALKLTSFFLKNWGAPSELVEMSLRRTKLRPLPPVGSSYIVKNRSF